MTHKIRIILETEQDVFRDIEIQETQTLFNLHNVIKDAFDLEGEEMASFYLSNDEWFQGSEIPLEDMSDEGDVETMHEVTITQVIPEKGGKMIYVYDFFSLWTFYCEVVETDVISVNTEFPAVAFSFGTRPDEAPEKDMLADLDLDFDDDDDDDFLEFGDAYDNAEW